MSDRLMTMISTKGQVILPKVMRDRRHWSAGTRLTVEESGDAVILRAASPLFPSRTIEEVAGCLKRYYDGPPLSLEDMDAAITAEAIDRARS